LELLSAHSGVQSEVGDGMKVRFSILMPAYNREKYVRQAIDSVLSQGFTDFEVFVIDDGSTDQTLQVLESYGPRIKVLQQRNQGPEVARNKAAALASGEYLVLLDSDDLLLPGALGIYDRIIRTFDSPPLIIGSLISFQDGESIPAHSQALLPVKILKYPTYLSKDVRIDLYTSMIVTRKSVFDEVGGLRNSTATTFHLDGFNLILKVGTYGPCVFVRKPYTVAYRQHASNTLRNLRAIADGILVLVRSEHQGEYPGGSKGRRGRYAFIGGIASTWAIKYCWRGGQIKLGMRLLLGSAPMVFVAVWKKFSNYLRKPIQPIVLPE
jgi:glycosyltransferase involved in cell wall biosynthesis